MESLPPWAQALKIPPESISAARRSAPSEDLLLSWCLDEGVVREQDYLEWARKNFELPVLEHSFFTNPPPMDLWKKMKKGPWGPRQLPVAEWEGTVFVGCIEPPVEPHPDFRYVLCAPSELKTWWPHFEEAIYDVAGISPYMDNKSQPSASPGVPNIRLDFKSLSVARSNQPPPPKPIDSGPKFPIGEEPTPPILSPIFSPSDSTSASHPKVNETFKKMSSYDQCMVLLFKDGKLTPWQWDESFKPDSRRQREIDLTHPSVFKIVMDTRNPYHGRISPSPINDSFFHTWNHGAYAEHITLLPLLNSGQIFGILLGLTTKHRGDTIPLDSFQLLADELSGVLLNGRSKAA